MKELKLIDYWADQLKVTSPAGGTVTIETERVDRGMTYHILACNICNETKDNRRLEIGIKDGSEYHAIRKYTVSSNYFSFPTEVKDVILTEGQQLYGKVYSTVTGNECTLTFNGRLYKKE